MPLISARNLGHAYGATDLFSDLALQIEQRERIGLVGPNGVGKTTLLRIIAGDEEPEEGEIHLQGDLNLGYLRQEAVLAFAGQNNAVYEEMLTVFGDLLTLETEMRQLEARMSAGENSDELFSQYSELQTAHDAGGGYEYQVDIKRVLEGLGFSADQWETPLSHLSGGQQTRVLLGRLLLEKPDLLILDEPTNHLDADAVAWLEQTLRGWPGSLLIVSHDRYFLDRTVNRIWEMSAETLQLYKGNYSGYVAQRQANYDRELKLFEAEKERLDKEAEFIRKHIAGGKTDIAKGKLKRLTRDIILMEEVGVTGREGKSWSEIGGRARTLSINEAEKRLRDIKPPDNRPPRLNIKLASEIKSDRMVIRTQRLRIGYDDRFLFKTPKLRIERLDCIALIGPNGSGKSTFLKTLLGEHPPLKGTIEYGENLSVGYFAQAHEQLDPSQRVIDAIMSANDVGEQEARNILAQYLFRGHDVFKKVSALSGGERGRLALALLALQGANFLLLDEPTNHLDIPSQEILQEVLEGFDGTVMLVSHDRYLIDHLATQIWSIQNEELAVFDGDYAAYQEATAQKDEPKPESSPRRKTGKNMPDHGQKRGRKVEAAAQPSPPAPAPVDLSWVNTLSEPPPTEKKRKKRRNLADVELEIERTAAYLEKLYEELETAQVSGQSDEAAWLEEEIDAAQTELERLEEQLIS